LAAGAGGGGTSFVDEDDGDPGSGGFVDERPREVGAPPGGVDPPHNNFGADVDVEPTRVDDEGDGPHCARVVGDLPDETHPQLRLAFGHRQAKTASI
jgi:hypothetical protein